jgi:hypothetical protein
MLSLVAAYVLAEELGQQRYMAVRHDGNASQPRLDEARRCIQRDSHVFQAAELNRLVEHLLFCRLRHVVERTAKTAALLRLPSGLTRFNSLLSALFVRSGERERRQEAQHL